MDQLGVGEAIRIPTGVTVDSDNYYLPAASPGAVSAHSGRTPSIVLIHSPQRNKLNKFQEVPRIAAGKSKIPVLQRSIAPSSFLRTNIYGQPVSASSRNSSLSNHNSKPSISFPTDRAIYEQIISNGSTSRNLPVLPAIGVSSIDHASHYSPRQPVTANSLQEVENANNTSQVTIPTVLHNGLPNNTKQLYHVTNAKPVFQMKAEYSNMLQRYANNPGHLQGVPPHQHNSRAPCKGCGRQVRGHAGSQVTAQAPSQVPPATANPPTNTDVEQNYVQQWLVNPSHPYQLPTEQVQPKIPSVPLVFTTPSAPESPSNTPTSSQERKVATKQADIPIRYTQAPTQQIISKTSGKLLSPEDALKRTLKRKKIPPLTKRNSLRSIFSDASSNLQKIAEEMDEDRESGGHSVNQSVSRSGYTSAVSSVTSYTSVSRQSMAEGDPVISVHPPLDASRKVLERGSVTRTHYALLCRMLVEAGNLVLTSVFNKIYPPLSLADNLSKPQVQKTLRRMKSQGILSSQYWELLYPKKKSSVTADSFGSSLLVTLLKSICHLSPPYPNGWSDQPLHGDKGLSADLARLTWYRKHVATMESLTDDQFSTHWNQLCTILTRLAASAPAAIIKRIQREVLTYDDQQFYIQALATSHREQEILAAKEKKSVPRGRGNRRGTIMALKMNPSLKTKSGTFVVSSDDARSAGTSSVATSGGQAKKSVVISTSGYKSGSTGMKVGNRNTLLVCYKMLSQEVDADDCLDYLLTQRVVSKEEKNIICSPPSSHRMKELLDALLNKTSDAYGDLLNGIKPKHPEVWQRVSNTYTALEHQPALKSKDVRNVLKNHLKSVYSEVCSQIRPYFWDQRIVTDIQSFYIQLDITDLKGLRSNIHRSRRYPIERLFSESSRPHRVLLQGSSGSGKTTYCRKLLHDWSRGDNLQTFDFVIYLDLNRLGDSLEDSVYSQLQFYQSEVKLSKQEVMSVLMATQRRLLFILDVFDSNEMHPQVLSLLRGELLGESSLLLTCLPEQVRELSPLCHRRLLNLGLDAARQEQYIKQYALLNRDAAEGYGTLVSSTLRNLGKAYEYMMSVPQWLNLLCLVTQNEENLEESTTPSLLVHKAFSIYPFLYCLQQSVPYDPENPPTDVLYALNQLQSLALETILGTHSTSISYEHVQHKYGCKLLMQLGVLDTYREIKDNKPQQMVSFRSKAIQQFLAAMKLSQLPPDQVKLYLQAVLADPRLHRVCVYYVSCQLYLNDSSTNSQLLDLFSQMAKRNVAVHKSVTDEMPSLGDFAVSLECVNECRSRKDCVKVIGQSLPNKIVVSPEHVCSSLALKGLNTIMERNFSRVSHIKVVLEASSHFDMETLLELAECIRNSTSVTQLNISYTSTQLLTHFLCHVTNSYRANILTLVFECKASPAEKLSASTYTDLKSAISSLSGITSFKLSSCRNSLALRNIVRNLPHTLHSLEITDSLLDSSALDITAYLDGSPALHLLNLEACDLSDGATGMNLFKGVRNNRSLVQLRLRGATLNTQTIKVLCEALKFNRVLQYLDIRDMELSTQACVSLAGVINVNDSLKELKLSNSYANRDGLTILNGTRARDGFKLMGE